MLRKSMQAVLALSLLFTFGAEAKPKKCKTFCNLIVNRCLRVRGNVTIDGGLAVAGPLILGGVSLDPLVGLAGAIGPAGAPGVPGLGTLVSGIIPFGSGLGAGSAAPVTFAAGFLVPTSFVTGFGSNAVITGLVDPTLQITETAFAFDVPAAGTLHNLQASIDANYLLTTGTFPITFTLFRSTASATGTPNAYVTTGLTATATLTPPAAAPALRTANGSTTGSITVAAGDRIVLVVSTPVIPAANISLVGWNGGVMYTPA